MALDKEIDRLYELPLDEFTAARNALAKELSGDERERVKALRKPTAAAWALNQAVRGSPKRLAEFLDAGRELREAHEALLAGGEREPADAATRREREAAGALTDEAEAAAGGGSPSLRERVAATLRAALADDDTRAELEGGRLVREHEAVGLGPLGAGAPAGAGRARKQKRDSRRAGKRELDDARKRKQKARRSADNAAQTVTSARKRAEAAMEALERAQGEEEQARTAAEEAAAAVEALERRLE